MKRQALTLALLLALALAGRGQDPISHLTIGDLDIFESSDSITADCILGKVSYNVETNTLMLHNASIESDIILWGSCFKIRLYGENSIKNIWIAPDSCFIYGPGSLNIGSTTEGTAVRAVRVPYFYIIDEAIINITASGYGIYTDYDFMGGVGEEYVPTTLIIVNSTLRVRAPYCSYHVDGWLLADCHVAVPENVVYNPSTYQLTQNGTWLYFITDSLEILPGGVGVFEHNGDCPQILGKEGGIRVNGLSGAEQMEVSDLLGHILYRANLHDTNTFIPMRGGIYIVKVGNHTKKVVVL